MQVKFSLRKDKIDKHGLAPIRMIITFNGLRVRRVVKGVKTSVKDWKIKDQRIKTPLKSESYNYHIEYNKLIDEQENKAKELFRYILLNNITPTEEYIIEKLEKDNILLSFDFLTCFKEFLDKNKNTKAERTIKGYTTAYNYFKEFQDYSGYDLRFDTINLEFLEKIRDYSFEVKEIKNNYFSRIITVLKTFMTWSFDREYHNNLAYKKFKITENEIEVIYLTIDELMSLYNHEFESRRLEHVKDTYCFGCFTGLRFSDIKQLNSSHIFDDHIKINIQKTKTIDHKIPLNDYAKSILEKYKDTIYEPLPTISSQKFNKYLKECCEAVGIDTPTTITRYVGQKRIDKTVPKHQLITSHTARKTFVTNSLVLGMNQMVVRNITGHKKEESFRRYVKIADSYKKQEMDNTWNKINHPEGNLLSKINKRVFWDIDPTQLDWKKDKDFIIARTLERGTDKEIAEIERRFSKKEILRALTSSRGASKRTINYYETVL